MVLGWIIQVQGVSGRIVEAEAYTQDDPASHSFRGPRGRNLPMFLPAGHLYVYRSYGVHWCANLVTGAEGSGEAVLIRALEPLEGVPIMRRRRGPGIPLHALCRGPGNAAKALGLSGRDSGLKLGSRVRLLPGDPPAKIQRSKRVGVTSNGVLWRFFDADSQFVSRSRKGVPWEQGNEPSLQ